jgi:hypothetical protein
MSTTKAHTAAILYFWVGAYIIEVTTRANFFFLVQVPPFLYLFRYFTPIVEMKTGHARLSQIFAVIISLDTLGYGGYYIITAKHYNIYCKDAHPCEVVQMGWAVVMLFFGIFACFAVAFAHQVRTL